MLKKSIPPNEEFLKVIEYAKRKKVNYLFLSHTRLDDTPGVVILEEDNLPQGLKLVYSE